MILISCARSFRKLNRNAVLGSVQNFSAKSCLSIVNLEVVDGETLSTYTFADVARRKKLMAALQA